MRNVTTAPWACPNCGQSHYTDSAIETTAVHYPPIIKDGVNVNPDRNRRRFTRTCIACGTTATVEVDAGKRAGEK